MQTVVSSAVDEVKLKKGYNSLLAVADEIPDPSMNVTLPSGKIHVTDDLMRI